MCEKNNAIDFLKSFFSLCIVGIHTQVLNVLPVKAEWYLTHLIFRLAVPFFFVASGYFYGKKLVKCEDTNQCLCAASKYIKANLLPFIFWGGGRTDMEHSTWH